MSRRTLLTFAFLASLFALAAAPPPRGDDGQPLPTVERALAQVGRKLVTHLQAKGYANVGVLAFQVHGASAGTLGLRLARQTELALVLRNPPTKPLGILRDASAIARATPRTDYRGPYGRFKLFSLRYPLAWGDTRVEADAFLTGRAVVAENRESVTIAFDLVDGRHARLTALPEDCTIQARLDAGKLGELGERFVLATEVEGEPVERERKLHDLAIRSARTARREGATASPVKLQVWYDGKEVPLDARDGRLLVAPPEGGQKVELVLSRDDSPTPYACVLKVDGRNTIDEEDLPDLECRRWKLHPGAPPRRVTIPRLTTRADSGDETPYGFPTGSIRLIVYRPRRGPPSLADALDRDADRENVLRMARPLGGKAASFEALRAELDAVANRSRRDGGMTLPGDLDDGTDPKARFVPDVVPVACLTVVVAPRR